MFTSETRLPHLVPPRWYHDADHYRRERAHVLRPGWHVVGTTDELAVDGDFLTCNLFGEPTIVRNFGGRLAAFANVCAHRHCLLTNEPRGRAPTLRCQYHGWEYKADGCPGKIPEPKNFVPYDDREERLRAFRVETVGQLVFVSPSTDGPDLVDSLGDFHDVLADRFDARWRRALSWEPTFDANWKVVVENSLEAYHVPCVHPHTFREDPGEERSEHVLKPHRTAFGTKLPFSHASRRDRLFHAWEGWWLRRLGHEPTHDYWQHHVFPNLLFSFTDTVSLCHCVVPTGPNTCRGVVRQFGLVGGSAPARLVCRSWNRFSAQVTKGIMREDSTIFPRIQRGLEASRHPGVLGRCEERLHAFQEHLVGLLGSPRECAREAATCTDHSEADS